MSPGTSVPVSVEVILLIISFPLFFPPPLWGRHPQVTSKLALLYQGFYVLPQLEAILGIMPMVPMELAELFHVLFVVRGHGLWALNSSSLPFQGHEDVFPCGV